MRALVIILLAAFTVACDNKQSLQEFYVEKQEDSNYNAIDLAPSLLLNEETNLEPEQKQTLETIKKLNVLFYPNDSLNPNKMDEERSKLSTILNDEKYSLLGKFGSYNQKAELYYVGEEDAIDELIVVGFMEEKGFAVARVLGDDMDPNAVMKLYKSLGENSLNPEGIEQIKNLFQEN